MIGTGIWRETLRNEKNDKCTLQDMTYGENTDKQKRELHMVGTKIWRETLKNLKKNKCTLNELEYGQKSEKTMKRRHTQCRTWNMAIKLTNEENENLTWQELEYGEKH